MVTLCDSKHTQIGTTAALLVGCLIFWSLAGLQPPSNASGLFLLFTGVAPCRQSAPCNTANNSAGLERLSLDVGDLGKDRQPAALDVEVTATYKFDKADPVAARCECRGDAMISGSALQGLLVGQRKCIAVNLDATTGGRLNLTRQWRDNLRLWKQDTHMIGVVAVVRGLKSARLVSLTNRGQHCFTGDVIVPREGAYAIEVLARLEEPGLRNQALLLADPIPVTAVGDLEGDAMAETYDSGSKTCPTFSDIARRLNDPLANGAGFWVPCSEAPYLPNCNAILEDGWTFLQPDCHYPLYDHEMLVAKLTAFAETVPPQTQSERKKLGVMILGDSRSRGLFLELASRVLSPETAANLTGSEYFKVWGIIHFETPTISLTWRDMRAYSRPCPDFAEAFIWPEGVTLGFERIRKCVTRQAEVRDDLAQLVATVKPDLIYAQHGFVPLDEILENTPQVVRVALLGWAQLSKDLGMVSDVVDWPRGSERWYKFNTLQVELPMYRELCNEHPKSVLDIHMHTVCGVDGDRLCGVVNQMTVQIMLHDVMERLPYIAYMRSHVPKNGAASWTLRGTDGVLHQAHIPDGWATAGANQKARFHPPGVPNKPTPLYACRGGTDNFEPDYVLNLLDRLECKREIVRVPGIRDTHQKCSNYSILENMGTLEPHKWLWQFTKLDERYRTGPDSEIEDDE